MEKQQLIELARELKYAHWAKRILQIEMKKRGLGYRELTEKLNQLKDWAPENERNVRNKIGRGTFSAAFMVECLLAMGCRSIDLGFLADVILEERQ
jgi:hypothetical protein